MTDFKDREWREQLYKAAETLEQQRNGRGPRERVEIELPDKPGWDIEPYVNWIKAYGPAIGAKVIVDGRELPNPDVGNQPVATGGGLGLARAVGTLFSGLGEVLAFFGCAIGAGLIAAVVVGLAIALGVVH